MDSKQVSQLTTGIVVIVVGLLMLGHQLHLGFDFGRLWPVLLLIPGLSRFAGGEGEGRRGTGGWMILVAVLLLLNNYHILGLRESWPLFVIGAGLAIMFGRGRRGERSRRRRDAMADAVPASAEVPPDGRPQP
jgi:hypothetical protein